MNAKQAARRNSGLAVGHILVLLEIHVFPYLDQCAHLVSDLDKKRYFLDGLMHREMIEIDLIGDLDGVPFKLTERGTCYIESLRRVRLPAQKWVPSDEQ